MTLFALTVDVSENGVGGDRKCRGHQLLGKIYPLIGPTWGRELLFPPHKPFVVCIVRIFGFGGGAW